MTIEIWKKIQQIDKAIMELDDKSHLFSDLQYDKIISELIVAKDQEISNLVTVCGKKNFNNCSNRLLRCGQCEKGCKYKRRDFSSPYRWVKPQL